MSKKHGKGDYDFQGNEYCSSKMLALHLIKFDIHNANQRKKKAWDMKI